MAFLCETPEPTAAPPQVVTQQSDPLFRDAFQKIMSRADVEAARPYQPYGQQRIADLTPDTQNSFGLTRANVGAYQPYLGLAGAQAANAGLALNQRNVADYMNPYTQNVVDIAKREAIRGDDIQRQQRNFTASKAGAFGGSRHGIVEAEAGRNLGQRLDDIQQQGLSSAYDKAMGAINQESTNQARSAAVLGELGGATQRLGQADASALDAIGTRQQQQTQAGLDLAYKDFLAQRDYDKDQIKFLGSTLAGAPQAASSRQTETSQFTPQASPISQAAGLGTAGLGLYGLYKNLFNEGGAVRGFAEGGETDDLVFESFRPGPNDTPATLLAKSINRAIQRGLDPRFVMRKAGEQFGKPAVDAARRFFLEPASQVPGPPAPDPEPRQYVASNEEENAPKPPQTLADAPPPAAAGMVPPPSTQKPSAFDVAAPPKVSFTAPTLPTLGDMGSLDMSGVDAIPTPDKARAAVPKREAELAKGDNTPAWILPVLRAGLAMMQAKPGQSALAGIGAGGEAGLEQAMKDKTERQKIEAENQRRRERAEDMTMRDRDAAAADANAARADAFRKIGAEAQSKGLEIQQFQARLSAAVQSGQLSLEQAKLALAGYSAENDRIRTSQQGRYYDTLSQQGARQGFQTLYNPETKQTLFHDPSKGDPPPGFQPVGALREGGGDETRRLRISTEAGKRVMADPNYLGMDEAAKNRAFSNMYRQVEREMYGSESGGTMGSGPPPLMLPPKK